MRLLLISGLGPSVIHTGAFDGTLFADDVPRELSDTYARLAGRPVDIRAFHLPAEHGRLLLRPSRGVAPHLPTATVRSILEGADIDHDWFAIDGIWSGKAEPTGDYAVVGLSTTFIWDAATLALVIAWIRARFPAATLVLGGQYSNLKFADILARHPEVDFVIRGDAEFALPAFIGALRGRGSLSDVPNLAWRGPDGSVQAPPLQYIDIESHPSPGFRGPLPMVPYESMRGCPFTCKFCSFPAASPKWRFKSAGKIVRDWAGYAEQNGAELIKAYDSTFTIPPARFRQLLDALPALGVPWEGYSRANALGSREIVDKLEAARCRRLFIGFESMNATALANMDKKVSVEQNRRAFEALKGSSLEVRGSFLVGYPGETAADYQQTHDFLVQEYRGLFNVQFFLFTDETMPVWQDAPIYDLEVTNGWTWTHAGMDSITAMRLRLKTLHEVRWKNDHAVNDVWQSAYTRPFMAGAPLSVNLKIEKALERLGHVVKDFGDGEAAAERCRALLDELTALGVETRLPAVTGGVPDPVEHLGVA
ncbi:MAG: radical SAM protein [Vicinamibacterales bacterium]|nr:radical SAM protein [Vicinamibacterales bacterium]